VARVEIQSQAWGVLVDANGKPLSGQTATLKNLDGSNATVWTAVTGGSSNTSSLSSDAFGGLGQSAATRYVEEGTYTLEVAAITRRVEAVAGVSVQINVRDYGALGNGADQTVALQAAIAALPAEGGMLYFPRRQGGGAGDYRYSSTLNFDGKRSVVLRGDGGGTTGVAPATTLYYTGTGAGTGISARGGSGFTIIDIWLSYSNSAFSGKILDFSGSGTDTSEPCLVRCRVGSGASAPYNGIGLYLDQAINGSYYRCNFTGNNYGVYGKASHTSYSVRHAFFGCRFGGSDTKHVYNADNAWSFFGTTVQESSAGAGSKPCFIGYDAGQAQYNLLIHGGWSGDVAAGQTSPQIEFAGRGLTVSGIQIAGGGNNSGAVGINVKPPESTLTADPGAGGTTINVGQGFTTFGDSGTVLIETEEVTFTGRTATTLTGCTRGANGTTGAAHAIGTPVYFLGDTHGIDIDAGTTFASLEYGIALRRGVRSNSFDIRGRGKIASIKGGSGALTAVALYEAGVTGPRGGSGSNGLKGILVPSPAAGGSDTTSLLVANRALFGRIVPERDYRVLAIAFGVTAAATADDAVDLGIYKVVNRDLTRVGSLGATTGLLNSTGIKAPVLGTPIIMAAGEVYYVGLSCGTVGGTAATVAAHSMTGGFHHGLLHTVVGEWESIFEDTSHPLPASVTSLTAANVVAKLAAREF